MVAPTDFRGVHPPAQVRIRAAWIALALAAGAPLLFAASTAIRIPDWAKGRTLRIREVVIHPGDVFDMSEGDNFLYETANFFHATTRRRVIEREVLFRQGEILDWNLIEDTERRLRDLRFIAAARIEACLVSDEEVDVHVWTRDKFTLRAEIGGSFVGGASKGRLSIGEQNLFGLGKAVKFGVVRGSEDDYEHIKYADPQLFGTRLEFRTTIAHSDEGEMQAASIGLPFRSIDSAWSFSIAGKSERSEANYYDGGIHNSTDVPQRIWDGGGFVTYRWGPRYDKQSATLFVDLDDRDFGTPEGPDAAAIDVPPHALTTSALLRYGWERTWEFRKETAIDTLTQVEDIPLGLNMGVTAGPVARRERNEGMRWRLGHGLDGAFAFAPWEDHIVVVQGSGFAREGGGEYAGWQAGGFYHHYWKGLPCQTLAASFAFETVYEGDGLPAQLTLGEESGLRGYDAREFSGQKRFRASFEDRIFTPFEILSVRLGAVAFADFGYVWDRGESMKFSDIKKSVGVGLRFGSRPLLASQVIRIDFAFPLDNVDGRRQGVSVSFATGQVFTLFSHPDELDDDF
ncbi:MAG: BamA/TamA family outer membrane protein [Planctomycetes bacterium]|nr:BamA/TamA family outer membrane protein [Planctomycetota bacterium]